VSTLVRDLGVSDVTCRWSATSLNCLLLFPDYDRFAMFVAQCLPLRCHLSLITSLYPNPNYCSTTLPGLPRSDGPAKTSDCHQCCSLVYLQLRPRDTTPILKDLDWLRVPERIHYKLCVLTYRCLSGSAPPCLFELLKLVAVLESRQRLTSSSTSQLVMLYTRRSTIGDLPSLSLRHVHGTVYLTHYTNCRLLLTLTNI